MRNFVQSGTNLTVPAPADVISGDVVIVGSIIAIAADSASSGADVDVVTQGVFTLPKADAADIAVGAKVYWDSAARLVKVTASGNSLLGVAIAAAPVGAATVDVRLNGSFA